MEYFYDTSAILNGAIYSATGGYISPLSLMELENIKNNPKKPRELQAHAREALSFLTKTPSVFPYFCSVKAIQKILKKYDFLEDIPDHRIIATAILLNKELPLTFVTSDNAQYLFASETQQFECNLYESKQEQKADQGIKYCGQGKYYPTDKQLNSLYSDPKVNILGCTTNEFAEIFAGGELKDILFQDGSTYSPIKYRDIKNNYTGETVHPRNIEQKMAFALLQNPNIKVKLLTSAQGSGKTYVALNYALEQVERGKYQKMIFIRNNIIVEGTKDIGFLPGNIDEKMLIQAMCIADHVGGIDELKQLIDEDIIEIIPLSHIRGRSLRNSIVLCDECENLDDKLVTLLLSRIEESSEIIFCGDVAQVDSQKFEQNNGIYALLNNLAGNKLFGAVKLIRSERGSVAQLCDLIRPPYDN